VDLQLVGGGLTEEEVLREEMVDGMVDMQKVDSKKKSMTETVTDIAVGFVLFIPVNFFVLPLFVNDITNQNIAGMMMLSSIYTAIALARKYALRRWFESMRNKK
jgi:hypothetical protein